MNNEEKDQECLQKKLLARIRFKSIIRKAFANACWLNAIEERQLSTNPRRNIAVIVRRLAVKSILTLKEISILNTPHQYRSHEDREQLSTTVMALKCFEMIPSKIRETIVETCNFQFFNPGRVIIREGHHASAIYFVLDGEVTVSKRIYSHSDGKWIDDTRYALMPGDVFGLDGVIFGDRRAVTCTTAINTEVLCIFKENLNDQLRKALQISWEQIKAALKRFNEYFYHLTEHQIIECCTFSKIRQYNIEDVIYKVDEGTLNHTAYAYLLLKGQCMILQCLNMTSEIINKKTHFKLLDVLQDNKSKSTQQKPQIQVNDKKVIKNNVRFGNIKKVKTAMEGITEVNLTEEPIKETKVFVDVATLSVGSIFGIGEEMMDRFIVAKNVVQCLIIPRFWLLERPQNLGNIWQRTKIYYLTTIPSRQDIFADYVRTNKWNEHKSKVVNELFG